MLMDELQRLRGSHDRGLASMMRALRVAAAAHGRNAEVAHAAGVINPKFARREVEERLQTVERAQGAGLKQSRRLRVAADVHFPGLEPKPPPGRRRKGRKKRADAGAAKDGVTYAPTLQPMPRFTGAGPMVDGTLLSARGAAATASVADQQPPAGTWFGVEAGAVQQQPIGVGTV